jgi:hypothetical protein
MAGPEEKKDQQPATPGYTPSTSYDFSMTVGLGSGDSAKEVVIHAKDFDKVKANGLHFSLPDATTVTLGTLKEFIDWLNTTLKTTIPAQANTDWPDYIKGVFNSIVGITVTLDQLSVDQDKQDASGEYPPLKYNLTVTARPATAFSFSKDLPISVVGGGVGVTRTYTIIAPAKKQP